MIFFIHVANLKIDFFSHWNHNLFKFHHITESIWTKPQQKCWTTYFIIGLTRLFEFTPEKLMVQFREENGKELSCLD